MWTALMFKKLWDLRSFWGPVTNLEALRYTRAFAYLKARARRDQP